MKHISLIFCLALLLFSAQTILGQSSNVPSLKDGGAIRLEEGTQNIAVPVESIGLTQPITNRSSTGQPIDVPVPTLGISTESSLPIAPSNAPKAHFATKTHKFGTVEQGNKVNYKFQVTNTGNQELFLTSVQTSCGCTATEYPKNAIKPGESSFIEASFDTSGKLGPQSKTIAIYTNEQPEANFYILELIGEVIVPKK